jgi:predicted dehydrogenase
VKVAIVGCGLIGHKRAEALGEDRLVACFDVDAAAAARLAAEHDARPARSLEELLAAGADVVVVATPHDRLAATAVAALEAGAHVLVEKPAGVSVADVSSIAAAARAADRRVKVGFNHRFHPGIARAIETARSGRFGDVMFARARYGHGGRLGYEREWRMVPEVSGGGEMTDQGMHLLDLCHWLLGPLPLHSALLRTQYWAAPVEDNAAVILGEGGPDSPWATFHVSWTEWKNMFSLEIYCRTGKLQVDGLTRSYGPQRLTIYAMKPELGPPDVEVVDYPSEDPSWEAEWRHFRAALTAGDGRPLLGDLESARYAWSVLEDAYTRAGYPLAKAPA